MLYLIIINLCLLQPPQDRTWTKVSQDSTSITFHYSISDKQVGEYFQKKCPECYKDGWITCAYCKDAEVKYYKDGTLVILNMISSSSIPVVPNIVSHWHVNAITHKALFKSGLFIDFPEKSMLNW